MMTLDEAIVHAKETAKKLRAMTSVTNGKPYNECLECAKDHEQLADWLEELNRYRGKITKAYWIEYPNNHYYCSNCDNLRDVHDYYCEHCGCEMFDDDGNIVITKGGGA